MASGKRCLYEVLGLSRDCSPDEIRSAYKRLALQRHPDKLIRSGVSHEDATVQFQELVHAYEVLSDPKERAWYDSHRSQILFADLNASSNYAGPHSLVPDLFSFFTNAVYSGYTDCGKGFYKVYSDVFNKIYQNEINFVKRMGSRLDTVREAPIMGHLDSPYAQITAFYNYWLGFCTVMDFCWVDQYDVMAGPNRKSRRVIEDENKKLRKKAKRDYNDVVRKLAEFVKKRDKRVINMAMKRSEEMKKRKEEEKERKKKLEKERMERLKNYDEPEWTKIQEEDEFLGFDDDDEDKRKKKNEGKELYCVICSKKFKSEKQWKNHEQSKKHKEKVAEFKESISDDEEEEADGELEEDDFQESQVHSDELKERLEDLKIGKDEEEDEQGCVKTDRSSGEGNGFFHAEDISGEKPVEAEPSFRAGVNQALENRNRRSEAQELKTEENGFEEEELDEEDEASLLKSMVFEHRKRLNYQYSGDEAETLKTKLWSENDSSEARKTRSQDRRCGRENSESNGVDAMEDDLNQERRKDGSNCSEEEYDLPASFWGDANGGIDVNGRSTAIQSLGKKKVANNEASFKCNKSFKGKKAKVPSKKTGNLCERCGKEFDSRNKLHKHLAEEGHATLKHR